METPEKDFERDVQKRIRNEGSYAGRALAGLLLIGIGCVLLAEQLGVYIPSWLISWKMLLIAIGLFVGARRSFRSFFWMIPIIIGSAFLIDDLHPELSFRQYIWPILIIGMGLFMIVRPRRRSREYWRSWKYQVGSYAKDRPGSTEDYLESTTVFSGNKRKIISKDFKGGEINSCFGGTDIDLMQADIQGTVVLEINNVFSGTKLLVPPHWTVKSEVACVFGSIEDKRPPASQNTDPAKVLRLTGACVFAGIEIKSY